MKKFVTISREYGSGGKEIGKLLAKELGVKFYDKEIIDVEVEKMGFSAGEKTEERNGQPSGDRSRRS